MQHYVQLAVTTLILVAVAAAEEPPLPGAVPPASKCMVSLMQTDLRMKTLKEEAALHSPVQSMSESEGKPPQHRHAEGTVQSSFIQVLKDVGEGHEKGQAYNTVPAQLAEEDKEVTKASELDPSNEHLVELKASPEYEEKSRLQQATSKEQSKTIDVRLNSELQTQSHIKADNTVQKAYNTVPAQLTENAKEEVTKASELDPSNEHFVELKASPEYEEKSRLQQATSKKQPKTIDVRLNSELQTQSHMKADNTVQKTYNTVPAQLAEKAYFTVPAQLAEKEDKASSTLTELTASSEYAKKSRLQQATSKEQSKTIDVRLNSELQIQSHMMADSKKETKAGTIDVGMNSELELKSIAKTRSSSAAQTVALLKNMVEESNGVLMIMLLAGVLTCICSTAMLMGTQKQNPNDKYINDRTPPSGAFTGGGNAMGRRHSAMAALGANSQGLLAPYPQQSPLPSQQRTPVHSSAVVPPSPLPSQHRTPVHSSAVVPPGTTPQLSMRSLPSQNRTPVHSSAALPPGANMMENLQSSSNGSGELPQPGIRFDLPPICPSLILPHTEARFMIQMDHLKRSLLGPLGILGTSGRKLLHAVVSDADNRRCLTIASCGCEDDPRTVVRTTDPQTELEVFGKSGKFYGWLEFPGGNQALLTHSGNDGETNRVLKIDMGNAADLRMSASTMDGILLASAGRSGVAGQQADGKDTWKMQVKPGTDALLITSCMLALIVLKPWPTGDGRNSRPATGNGFTPQGSSTSLRYSQRHEPEPRNSVHSFFSR